MKRLYYKRNPKKFMNFEKQVENCKKVYLVYQGAKSYYYREYPYAGKFAKDEQLGFSPLVYNFDDCNGTDFIYEVMPISEVTTFTPIVYTFNPQMAQFIAATLNHIKEFEEYRTKKIKLEEIENDLKEQLLMVQNDKSIKDKIEILTESCDSWLKTAEKYYQIITSVNENNAEITGLKTNKKHNTRIIVKNKNIKGGK